MDDPESRIIALYNEHYRRVLAYALTRAASHSAEEVASEVFVVAWRRLDDVPDPALPWLLGVARNLLRKHRNSDYRQSALADRIIAFTGADEHATWDVADHVIERDSALAALAMLPERDLEVLTLVMWHDLAPRDAAKVLGCSATAFFVRLHRARRRLAKALDSAPQPRSIARSVPAAPRPTR